MSRGRHRRSGLLSFTCSRERNCSARRDNTGACLTTSFSRALISFRSSRWTARSSRRALLSRVRESLFRTSCNSDRASATIEVPSAACVHASWPAPRAARPTRARLYSCIQREFKHARSHPRRVTKPHNVRRRCSAARPKALNQVVHRHVRRCTCKHLRPPTDAFTTDNNICTHTCLIPARYFLPNQLFHGRCLSRSCRAPHHRRERTQPSPTQRDEPGGPWMTATSPDPIAKLIAPI